MKKGGLLWYTIVYSLRYLQEVFERPLRQRAQLDDEQLSAQLRQGLREDVRRVPEHSRLPEHTRR